jgi:3-oxoadipate enol-lactonase
MTQHRAAKADRLEIEVAGKGRDLLCLHSLLSDKTAFRPLMERLSDRRRMILVNMPGFGASSGCASDVDSYADAVATVFNDQSLPPTTDVIGNGLGGFVALALAARHGARFHRAVLVGSAIAFPEEGRATFRILAETAEREGMGALARAAVERMFPPAFIADEPSAVAAAEANFRTIDRAVFAASARALASLDFASRLRHVKNPVLIVVGEKDQATPPALARELANQLQNAQVVEMPGLGHVPHLQAPDLFLATISDFLGLEVRADDRAIRPQ